MAGSSYPKDEAIYVSSKKPICRDQPESFFLTPHTSHSFSNIHHERQLNSNRHHVNHSMMNTRILDFHNLSSNALESMKHPGAEPKIAPLNTLRLDLSDLNYSDSISLSPSASSAASIRSSSSLVPPTSSYWHIPDHSNYLTAIASHETNNLCAVGSGGNSNNLFIYELNPDGLTHHQTVTLPEISTLKWVSPRTRLGQTGNVLASGHKNGVVHLTLLPDSTSRTGQSAEILKRYNHTKHLTAVSGSQNRNRSFRIKSLELTSPEWRCASSNSFLSLCGDHIFMWEPNRSDSPLVMQKSSGTNALGLSCRDGVYALGRRKGVSIRDIRIRDKVNSGLKPPVDNDEPVSMVRWNPFDSGNLLAAVHDRTTIKIWDIRHKKPLASYTRHIDTVTGLEWSSPSEIVSASADGTVRVWNTSCGDDFASPSSSTSSSPVGSPVSSAFDSFSVFPTQWSDYNLRQHMDGELEGCTDDLLSNIPPVNHSRQFKAMTLTSMGPSVGALTIDTSGFLGVHDLADCASYSSSVTSLDFVAPLNI